MLGIELTLGRTCEWRAAILIAGCALACAKEEEECLPLPSAVPAVAQEPPADLCLGGTLKNARYTELGWPPDSSFEGGSWGVVAVNGEVILGAKGGLWRRSLDGRIPWRLYNPSAPSTNDLFTVPGVSGVVLATGDAAFHRSTDGGRTWCRSGVSELVGWGEPFITMGELTRQPGPQAGGIGVLYTTTLDGLIRESRDGGATWPVRFVEPFASSGGCGLHVPVWAWDTLYEGCTSGVILHRDITDRAVPLGEATIVNEDLGEHTPGYFASTLARPGVVYAGLVGGLLRIEGADSRWIYRWSNVNGRADPPWGDRTYIGMIWIDPCDPDHLVFGGTNPFDPRIFGLYESFDDGISIAPVPPPAPDLATAQIVRFAETGPAAKDLVFLLETRVPTPGTNTAGDPNYELSYKILVRTHSSDAIP